MRIIEADVKLTEEAVNGMKRTEYYLDGKSDFAMLSDNVFVILENSKARDGVEAVREEVNELIYEVLSNHPDFSSYLMDDSYLLVVVGGVYVFGREKTSKEEYEDRNIKFARSMLLRNELLEACKNKEILAIADASGNN